MNPSIKNVKILKKLPLIKQWNNTQECLFVNNKSYITIRPILIELKTNIIKNRY